MMQMRQAVALVGALLFLAKEVSPYGTGAPAAACVTMTPKHVNPTGGFIEGQTAASPYSISVSVNNYKPGDTVTVTVSDSRAADAAGFRGILMQARNPGAEVPLGTWISPPTDTKLTKCSVDGDSVTHANTNLKPSGTVFKWKAPNKNVGTVQFVATVAEMKEKFWLKLPANKSITYNSAKNLRMHTVYLAMTAIVALKALM
ncbi:putative defense protein 3 [Ciona intestinalis]